MIKNNETNKCMQTLQKCLPLKGFLYLEPSDFIKC